MDVVSINTNGSKPRKGALILTIENKEDMDLDLALPTSDFIASFRLKPRGAVLLELYQDDEQGILVELSVDEQENRPGYLDRNTKTRILKTGDPEPLHFYLSRLNTKDLTVAYRSSTGICSIYYFGKTTELQMSDFNPTRISLTTGFLYQLEKYSFFTHYNPDAPEFAYIPEIPLTWRKWFKNQLELTTGYGNFTMALRAYEDGNSVLGDPEFWDEVGLHVDEPVPEDFI